MMNGVTVTTSGLWLSRLRLNARHPDASRALRDAQALHALTMRCLPSDVSRAEANLLHYADLASGTVLVQTAVPPRWPETEAFRAQAKEITTFLEQLDDGDVLRFAVRAVPIRRCSTTLRDGSAAKNPGEHALRTDADRTAWLEQRLGAAARIRGFPTISLEPERVGYRNGERFVHRPTSFAGIIEVCDADAVRDLAVAGIGRVKSYGNGLLMLRRTG